MSDQPPLVMVEWEDSTQPISGWVWLEDQSCGYVVKCRSVGWLVHDGDGMKVLAPNIGHVGKDETVQASGVLFGYLHGA